MATKEGGAITGEQRLREYTDELYGDIQFAYDGKPTDYQLARIDALKRETDEVAEESFETFEKNDLAKANGALKSANQAEINVPDKAPDDDSNGGDRDSGEHRRPFERD